MSTIADVKNCYRYILGRDMNVEETQGAIATADSLGSVDVQDLRNTFLRSAEFHNRHQEILFENFVPKSVIVAYDSPLGFRIYLDLRQLHLSFGVMRNTYEQREIEILRRIVADDATFFDVGANVGCFSLSVATRPGFKGRVVAFEPLAPLFRLFERSIAENGLGNKITARQVALAAAPGSMTLTDAENSINAGSTRLMTGGVASANARIVKVETLDDVARDAPPDVIKVDIEGAEGLFLHGGRKTFETARPTLLFEVNSELLSVVSAVSPAQIQHWLTLRGYRLWVVQSDRLRGVLPDEDLDHIAPQIAVGNVLAIHSDRLSEVQRRLPELQ